MLRLASPPPQPPSSSSTPPSSTSTPPSSLSLLRTPSGLFCMNCKAPWHSTVSCNDFKILNPHPCAEDKKLKTLAKRNLWRQCVNCSHVVELPAGCNHIYCGEPKELRIRIAVLLTRFWLLIASCLFVL